MPRIFFSYFSQFRYSFIKSEPKFCKKGVRHHQNSVNAARKKSKKTKINRQRQVDPTIIWLFDPDFSWKVYLFNFILFNLKRTDSVGKTFIWPKIQKHCTHKTLRKIKAAAIPNPVNSTWNSCNLEFSRWIFFENFEIVQQLNSDCKDFNVTVHWSQITVDSYPWVSLWRILTMRPPRYFKFFKF